LLLYLSLGIVVVPLLGSVACLFLLHRIGLVHAESLRVLDLIHDAASQDIGEGIYAFEWRYEEFDKVSFSRMLYASWKPVDSWFKGHPATIPHRDLVAAGSERAR
jgi:hypothetical protein